MSAFAASGCDWNSASRLPNPSRRRRTVSGSGFRAVARRYRSRGVLRGGAAFPHHAFGEGARGFDEGDLVEQGERLQRGVRPRALRHAHLAVRRVEEQHRRRRSGAFPDRVEGAPVETVAGVGLVVAEVPVAARFVPDSLGHVGAHARAADRGTRSPAAARAWSRMSLAAQAEARSAREEPVLGISGGQFKASSTSSGDRRGS